MTTFANLVRSTLRTCGAIAVGVGAVIAAELPLWNHNPSRQAIVDFVEAVSTEGSKDFVPVAERIAVFDNDGTLWSEKPMYFQMTFAIDRIKAMAPANPEWQEKEPFKSLIAGDREALHHFGKHEILGAMVTAHAGMSSVEFSQIAKDWLNTATHPKTGRLYKTMTYKPMVELLDYLRGNDFKTYIVSGGGVQFIRAFAEEAYGIPPEQVIGSTIVTRYEVIDGKPTIVREPKFSFVDDKEGKPVRIDEVIGRRPLAAFGNSDGDFQMLEWTTAGEGKRLGALVHHTDAEREWAYDRKGHVGRLDRGLDEAEDRGWVLIDMAKDWKTVYGE